VRNDVSPVQGPEENPRKKSAWSKRLFDSRATRQSARLAKQHLFYDDGTPTGAGQRLILKALTVQHAVVDRHVRRIQNRHPHLTPQELVQKLGAQYLAAVSSSGALAGAAALVPGAGTLAGLGVSAVASVGFLELSALYAQSIAVVHGLPTHTDERGQALVMAVLLGDEGYSILQEAQNTMRGRGNLAATVLIANNGSGMFQAMFERLQKTFLKRIATSQVVSTIGRVIPFGIGALVGGYGNRRLGRSVISSTADLFGPLPRMLPQAVTGTAHAERELPAGSAAQVPSTNHARQGDEAPAGRSH
jgi:hypothetical protein